MWPKLSLFLKLMLIHFIIIISGNYQHLASVALIVKWASNEMLKHLLYVSLEVLVPQSDNSE